MVVQYIAGVRLNELLIDHNNWNVCDLWPKHLILSLLLLILRSGSVYRAHTSINFMNFKINEDIKFQ